MKKLIILLISLTLLTACGEKKIDASTKESFKNSVQEITTSLNEEDQKAFRQAIVQISIVSTFEAKGDQDQVEEILKKKLNGKTAAEVIKIAEKVQGSLNKIE